MLRVFVRGIRGEDVRLCAVRVVRGLRGEPDLLLAGGAVCQERRLSQLVERFEFVEPSDEVREEDGSELMEETVFY